MLWPALALTDAPEVMPYGPAVSNPAVLTAPGLYKFEASVVRAAGRTLAFDPGPAHRLNQNG